MRETQASLTSDLRWNLEIEKDADARGNAVLPNTAKAGAEIVGLNSPRDMRAPLDIHAAATHDSEGVK